MTTIQEKLINEGAWKVAIDLHQIRKRELRFLAIKELAEYAARLELQLKGMAESYCIAEVIELSNIAGGSAIAHKSMIIDFKPN